MENKRKFLFIFAFLSLLADAAVSIPLAHRHNHSRGEYAPASAAVGSTLRLNPLKGLTKPKKKLKPPPSPIRTPPPAPKFNTPPLPVPEPKVTPMLPPDFKKSIVNDINNAKSKLKQKKGFKKVFDDLSIKHKKTLKHLSALDDCLLMTTDTIQQIESSFEIFNEFSISKDIPLRGVHLLQAHQLLSAAQTNLATCIDGFSHCRGDKKVQEDIDLQQFLRNLHSLAGNVNSIADKLSGEAAETVKPPPPPPVKWMLGKDYWPEWLDDDDRKLLVEKEVKGLSLTVAKNGKGSPTVSEVVEVAVGVARRLKYNYKRIVIRITEGKYMENVVIPKELKNLTFVGDGYDKTFIIASKNVVDGNTTFNSATVGVAGDGFLASGITFMNSAGPPKLQAVALRVNADRSAFYNCSMIGYQNTLYVHSFRQFYKNCIINGTVDFIFGNAAAVLQDCDILPRPNPKQKNTITAQSRSNSQNITGIVILNSRITATLDAKGNPTTYLGRPWGKFSRTVVVRTEISEGIDPAGWSEWDGKFALDTLEYAEYNNTGAGAETKGRVKWKGFRVLNNLAEAQKIVSEMGFN